MPGRDNESQVILPSTSRAVRTNSRDITNPGYSGGIFTFDVTANASTVVSPRFFVQGKVPGTTKYYAIGTVGTATGSTADGVRRLVVYPGVSTANASTVGVVEQEHVSQPLPYVFRIASTASSTGTVTFSAGVDLIG